MLKLKTRPFFLALTLFSLLLPSIASSAKAANESDSTDLYKIMDIAIDASAPTAAQARDKAIMDAQHAGYNQLAARLDSKDAPQPDDTNLAHLVQGFEVQKEKSLQGRYIGTFTVQFKPQAVRDFFNKKGIAYRETRSRPFVVLPIYQKDSKKAVLWEDRTPWRAAWEDSARNSGIVPIIVPSGDLDDIALINAPEALEGRTESLQAVAKKYGSAGVIVATLSGQFEPLDKQTEFKATLQLFDTNGTAEIADKITVTIAPPTTPKGIPSILAELIKKARIDLETTWKQADKNKIPPSATGSSAPAATAHLPAIVTTPSLETWEMLRTKISSASAISHINILSMSRGAVHIDIEFQGDIPALQTSLAQKGLNLSQNATGAWIVTGE